MSEVPVCGTFIPSIVLSKKLNFLKKHTNRLNIEPNKIYTAKYFLDLPRFTDKSFNIETKYFSGLLNAQNFTISEDKIIIKSDMRNYSNNRTNTSESTDNYFTISYNETIKISEIDQFSFNLTDPLISLEPRPDFFKFISALDQKYKLDLTISSDGTLRCTINETLRYKYEQIGCKVPLHTVDTISIAIRMIDLNFIKDILDTTMVLCVFDDCMVVYSYDMDCTLAARVPILA